MSSHNRRGLRPSLTLLAVIALITAVIYLWGAEIWAFVTGRDILTDLTSELAARPRPTPTPSMNTNSIAPAPASPTLTSDTGIAPDGFPVTPREHVFKYTVQEGDALVLIAQRFGLSPNTIFWSNTETLQDNVHLLRVGMELVILPVDGVYHTSDGTQTIAEIAAQYNVTPGDILYSPYNTLSDQTSSYIPPVGMPLVVQYGRRDFISWQAPIRTGTQSGAANPEGTTHPGSCRETYIGSGGSGNYMNPLGSVPYRVTNLFAPYHPGVDLAADLNTPIYAAETGVVVFAGWHRDGYGELVIVDHGEGWTTYYAHLARRYVDCGQQVTRGQYIGDMGLSGNATGVHLHFEIRQNDAAQNPYSYIDIQDMRTSQGG